MKSSNGQVDIAPAEVVKQYGADILRLWVAQTDYTNDQRIGPEILKGTADSYRRLRNTMRFMLGSLAGFSEADRVEPAAMPELERWVLHRLAELDHKVRKGYEAYDQVFDILDVWFDSGSTHAFVLRDREDGSEDGIADLYLEGTDQHRGWFHSSLLQSCGTNGRAPYRGGAGREA